MKNNIYSIIFKHNTNDFTYYSDFSLTPEEESIIMKILENHQNEGFSIRGKKEEIIKEL
jgi:hypothetical protein